MFALLVVDEFSMVRPVSDRVSNFPRMIFHGSSFPDSKSRKRFVCLFQRVSVSRLDLPFCFVERLSALLEVDPTQPWRVGNLPSPFLQKEESSATTSGRSLYSLRATVGVGLQVVELSGRGVFLDFGFG